MKTDNKILFASGLETLSQYWYSFDKVSMDLHNDERKIENVMTDFEKNYIIYFWMCAYINSCTCCNA